MGVNINYDPATFVVATATPRQWRVRFSVEKDGVTKNYDVLFPDELQTLVSNQVITTADLKDWLFELVTRIIYKKEGYF